MCLYALWWFLCLEMGSVNNAVWSPGGVLAQTHEPDAPAGEQNLLLITFQMQTQEGVVPSSESSHFLSGILWPRLSKYASPALYQDHTVVKFGSLWRWKAWRKMNGVQCSASQFLLQYIKCVFFTAYGFSFHFRGERSCSEADVCARVWWAPWICQLCVFLLFSLHCHSFLPSFCFSFIISLLNHPPPSRLPSLLDR